uniref:Uncharacterized protein n=1 Tax=Lepeophtheirus salmonis TaxID=72036 RepID=A0A0K2TEY8_LEPSM
MKLLFNIFGDFLPLKKKKLEFEQSIFRTKVQKSTADNKVYCIFLC